VDGDIGLQSIAQINAQNAVELLAAYRTRAEERYQEIAAADATLAGDLSGWPARLNA
jgi:hypothetical protein